MNNLAASLADPAINPTLTVQGENATWRVLRLVSRGDNATGSNFSTGYVVSDQEGKEYYLKAVDLPRVIQFAPSYRESPVAALNEATKAFLYEARISDYCRSGGAHRVVCAVDHGELLLDPRRPMDLVPFLVFELADGDIRAVSVRTNWIDFEWIFRVLRDTATGIRQLHKLNVAHQDIKPSNVMCFEHRARIGDLGRVVCSSLPESVFREPRFTGDNNYAAPEVTYFVQPTSWSEMYRGDIYMLGGIAAYLVASINVTSALTNLVERIDGDYSPWVWRGSYDAILPMLVSVFPQVISSITSAVPPPLQVRFERLLTVLCHPDPKRRNFAGEANSQMVLEKAVSRLDHLCRLAGAYRAGRLRSSK